MSAHSRDLTRKLRIGVWDGAMLKELETPLTECATAEGAFFPYGAWAKAVVGELSGVCVLDGRLGVLEACGSVDAAQAAARARALGWLNDIAPRAAVDEVYEGRYRSLLPVEADSGELHGVLVIEYPRAPDVNAPDFAARLSPLIGCLRRQFEAGRTGRRARQALSERSADLQWLIELVTSVQRASSDRQILHELLASATAHMHSAFGALYVPDKHLCLEHHDDADAVQEIADLWRRSRAHLSAWARQKRRPLVLNGRGEFAPRCKILIAPIVAAEGAVIGVLVFCRLPDARNYRQRHLLLAGHLGRLTTGMIESQFDVMTGLYSREGLEQMYAPIAAAGGGEHSVLYLDIDQMHVVNELYGFEIGNELLVRVGELLGPPHLPHGALAARIAADRFAVLLTGMDTPSAAALAERLQEVIHDLVIGPVDNPIDVSASCGVAALLSLPQGLARALAAAELACKTAKKRGRNRLKVDTCDDGTMLRRHADAMTVGQLRSALKTDQLLLYAQRIVPLRDPTRPGGYEILLRLNDPADGIVLPGTLVQVAQRYQLLPLIDRWVVRKTLQMLSVHRAVLEASGVGISINLSGQSIGDEEFTRHLGEELRAAQLPPGTITFEITEQAAVSSLARAEEMIRTLAPWECRFALDDFGTGSNSLAYLNALPIARVKIDGAFVRDILTNPRSQATVRGIVELARGFSIDTVAEFVETAAIADRVRELGVDYAQGYAFGRPRPFDALLLDLDRCGAPTGAAAEPPMSHES